MHPVSNDQSWLLNSKISKPTNLDGNWVSFVLDNLEKNSHLIIVYMHKCFPKASENGEPFSHFKAWSLGEVVTL